ncbi:hypothetical protein F4553_006131 [Allocatelliglobosispora scoriae]|uniref:DUF3291 domain-containing protein n=2 Tax=Allocatelliglobosispora scoriae TaxID=643052 RepID=A0A841BUB2_9ACTN|nr:hypothetical protein [Allocatelliglobosispora scoriae]
MTGMAHHLAQLNIARARFPIDSPRFRSFLDGLAPLNDLAESSPGYVWRLIGEAEQGAIDIVTPFGDNVIVNMSVWETVESLRDYTYNSGHLDYLRRRREWLDHENITGHLVLWWVPVGHIPDLAEAADRLAHLEQHGPTEHAFTLRHPSPPPIS